MKKLFIFLMGIAVAMSAFGGGQNEGTAAAELPTLTVLNGTEPPSLDSSLMSDTTSSRIHQSLFECLIGYHPETNLGEPGVAESWTMNTDGSVYTFKLRKSNWSDGVPINAQTVVDSWLRTLDPATGSSYAWMMNMVVAGASEYNSGDAGPDAVKIKAVDDYTFQVELVSPAAYFIGMLPHQIFGILPLHVIEEHGDKWTLPENIVSNGPFLLEEWKPQEVLTVVKNPDYWDADKVKLGKIVFIPSDDDNTRLNMYLNAEADWMRGGMPPDQLPTLMQRDDFQIVPALGTYYFAMNQSEPPFDNVNLRKALNAAIDKQVLVDKVSRGGQLPADTVVPTLGGYTPPEGNGFNVEKAKEYLAAAGYPNGAGFPDVTYLYNTSEGHRVIAEYAQQQWETNLNINIKIENTEWKTVLARGKEQDFQIMRLGWIGDYQDPNTFLE
ncbi:MAG: peptide ABC transporter substrate-binding protein, partial [Spirochaetales bacterium]|nr:peptide ABC transporter substrate-binding protein [Spirochaetales bacterium]